MKRLTEFGPFTLRTRLTALYGLAFLIAGGVLVAVMYGVVALELERQPSVAFEASGAADPTTEPPGTTRLLEPDKDLVRKIEDAEEKRRDATLANLLQESLIALALVGVTAAALGYLIAGRALRPLAQITDTARRVAERSLHERIDLDGPPDEIKQLADTFDDMLARLDQSFAGQRHFVGNASHELRTPLAVERTLLEVALADPTASEDLKTVGKTLLETNARSERLIDGLLMLARSENAVQDRQVTDLATLVRDSLTTCAEELRAQQVTVHENLQAAAVAGDIDLLGQLVLNLIQNAIRHNHPLGGQLWASTTVDGDEVVLTVTNTGPLVPGTDVGRVFEPFVRLSRERTGASQGLGLSIVRSVAHSHGGSVVAQPREGGGLTVTARLPRASSPSDRNGR